VAWMGCEKAIFATMHEHRRHEADCNQYELDYDALEAEEEVPGAAWNVCDRYGNGDFRNFELHYLRKRTNGKFSNCLHDTTLRLFSFTLCLRCFPSCNLCVGLLSLKFEFCNLYLVLSL
jgi:hypothetical protein